MPAGVERVGCIGRRSPGFRGGRMPGAVGRGRWKIGWPGTGRPGAGRGVVVPCASAARSGGALYTGRGPVCGMMTRGLGSAGGFGGGAAGCFTSTAGGAATTGGGGGADGAFVAGGAAVEADGATGAAGTVNTGRGAAGGGTIRRGFGASTGAGAGAAGFASTGGFAETGGFAAAGGFGAGGAGVAAAAGPAFLLMIAFSTSPGLEMCDRSILVLMASGSARDAEGFAAACSA
jgi:hypothetical protein